MREPTLPEHRLLRALLLRAMVDASKQPPKAGGGRRSRRHKREGRVDSRRAVDWLYSDDTHPMSYLWVCTELGIDPGVPRSCVETQPGRIRELFRCSGNMAERKKQ